MESRDIAFFFFGDMRCVQASESCRELDCKPGAVSGKKHLGDSLICIEAVKGIGASEEGRGSCWNARGMGNEKCETKW